jgi:hypothetical protein
MPISATDFLKKHGYNEEEKGDHSLQHNAKEHAKNLKKPHAGTPHDWEDWERYKLEHPDEVADDDTDEK